MAGAARSVRVTRRAIVFSGGQASGKTTFYREHFAATYVHVSLDKLRSRRREQQMLDSCIEAGLPFVVDNTNPTRADRARYIAPARRAGYRIVSYFFDVAPAAAIAANRNRSDRPGLTRDAIMHTYKSLERPSASEGFGELLVVTWGADRSFVVQQSFAI